MSPLAKEFPDVPDVVVEVLSLSNRDEDLYIKHPVYREAKGNVEDRGGTMEQAWLHCRQCKADYPFGPLIFGCPHCLKKGQLSVLEMSYEYEQICESLSVNEWLNRRGSVWGYAELLPPISEEYQLSLGEGATPLLKSRWIAPKLGLKELYLKNETVNPTWSFKDRFNAVSVSVAASFGYKRAATTSTGNHGASAAAYAALAGMECIVFCPPETSRIMTAQIQAYGAYAFISEWNGRGKLLEYLVRHEGWFPVSSLMPNPVNNPFGVEGYKTLAYEITSQLGRMPDRMLHPCAAGNSLFAAWKGFNELQRMGMKGTLPQMIACQPAGANSLEQSFRQNLQEVVWLDNPHSIATSTREPTSSPQCLWALYESAGEVVSVSDEEILEAMRWLGREGICAESASAIPVASLVKLVEEGKVRKDDTLVCIITSTGIKWPEDLLRQVEKEPVTIEPDIEALQRFLQTVGLEKPQSSGRN